MLRSDGVVKIADFGLAAFSHRKNRDPWNVEKKVRSQLCAKLMGGTPSYFSPEQLWLFCRVQTVDGESALLELDNERMLTPATSDLFQAALTMLEAHARFLPQLHAKRDGSLSADAKWVPAHAAGACAARTPRAKLATFSPEQTEDWLIERDIEEKSGCVVLGVLVAKGIDGAQLVELAFSSECRDLKKALGIKVLAQAKKLWMHIQRNVSTPADAIMHKKVGKKALYYALVPVVGERFESALETLCEGLGAKESYDLVEHVASLGDITQAVGGELLPPSALETFPDHDTGIIDETLGGLTKRLLEYDDVAGALASCAEWMGVGSDEARSNALSVYCKIFKEFGGELPKLDLSKGGHSHWTDDMLGGDGIMLLLATSLSFGAAAHLEAIDLSDQRGLAGPALETLLATCQFPMLRRLKLSRCERVNGIIPAAIGTCVSLITLDLSECRLTGELPFDVAHLVKMTSLRIAKNELSGESQRHRQKFSSSRRASHPHLLLLHKGTLPRALPSSLEILDCSDNSFTGAIPSEWAATLTNLKQLKLSNCGLCGSWLVFILVL